MKLLHMGKRRQVKESFPTITIFGHKFVHSTSRSKHTTKTIETYTFNDRESKHDSVLVNTTLVDIAVITFGGFKHNKRMKYQYEQNLCVTDQWALPE